jgi:hypothetical protein
MTDPGGGRPEYETVAEGRSDEEDQPKWGNDPGECGGCETGREDGPGVFC